MTLGISGAGGFTGAHILRIAAARGLHAAPMSADLTDARAVADDIARLAPTRFLHLAGISYVGHADPRAFYEVNLFGSINLLEALASLPRPPERVVLASSAMVYGNCQHSPIGEETPASPASHYAISKLAMEHAARPYVDRLPVVIARPFNYTGPGQSIDFVVPKLVDHFRHRAARVRLGNLDVQREYNDVRFVCEAYLQLLQHGRAGEIYNVCTGTTYDLAGVIGLLGKLTGHKLHVDVDPALVRTNEVHRLCGDPSRLRAALPALPSFSFEDTLRWMLTSPP